MTDAATRGRVNPHHRLDHQGIRGVAVAHYNYVEAALVEAAITRGEGRLGRGGAFLCATGQFTGRSPKDKFVVRSAQTESTIWWDNNAAMTPEAYARLKADMLAHVQGRELFVQDLYAGADPIHRLDVRVVTELAWHGLFIRHLLRRPRGRNWKASLRTGRSSTCPRSRPIRRGTAAGAKP